MLCNIFIVHELVQLLKSNSNKETPSKIYRTTNKLSLNHSTFHPCNPLEKVLGLPVRVHTSASLTFPYPSHSTHSPQLVHTEPQEQTPPQEKERNLEKDGNVRLVEELGTRSHSGHRALPHRLQLCHRCRAPPRHGIDSSPFTFHLRI
jgi:hypothetical protein